MAVAPALSKETPTLAPATGRVGILIRCGGTDVWARLSESSASAASSSCRRRAAALKCASSIRPQARYVEIEKELGAEYRD